MSEQISGKWWIADEPETSTKGTLKYGDNDTPVLEPIGPLSAEDEAQPFTGGKYPDLVIGESTTGQKISLINCLSNDRSGQVRRGRGGGAYSQEEYTFDRMYLTESLESPITDPDPELDSLAVRFPLIDDWGNLPHAMARRDGGKTTSAGDKLWVEYIYPETQTIELDDVKITLAVNVSTSGGSQEGSIEMNPVFRIAPKNGRMVLSGLLEYTVFVRDFISFGLGEPISATRLTGRIDFEDDQSTSSLLNREQRESLESLKYYVNSKAMKASLKLGDPYDSIAQKIMSMTRIRPDQYADIEIHQSKTNSRASDRSIHPHRMNFSLSDIEDNLSEVFKNWIRIHDNLEPVYNQYGAALRSSDMYIENKFLSYARAIEVYHRLAEGGQYLSDDNFESFQSDLEHVTWGDPRDAIEEHSSTSLHDKHKFENDFKQHLRDGTFEYANGYSFRKRINQLIDSHKDILDELPLNVEERKGEMYHTRNYLTHYGEDLEEEAATDERLVSLTWCAQALAEVCLLTELAIPDEQITDRLTRRFEQLDVNEPEDFPKP